PGTRRRARRRPLLAAPLHRQRGDPAAACRQPRAARRLHRVGLQGRQPRRIHAGPRRRRDQHPAAGTHRHSDLELAAMTWAALSASQIGSRHVRDGRANQDAHLTTTSTYGAVAAAADGHGHHAHPRSGTGALLAVRHLTELLETALPELTTVTVAETIVRDRIGPALVAAWRAAVEADAAAEPFPSGEHPDGPEETWLRYGTTVLALAATHEVVVVLQLGDGDAVVVSD